MKKRKCVLVVGHSANNQGARNKKSGVTEYVFNSILAECIENAFSFLKDVKLIVVNRKNGYNSLPGEINKLKPDFIVSMHCNAFDKKTSGGEALFSGSVAGRNLAQAFQMKLGLNRGIKSRTIEQRGGYLLHKTKAPCVIVEPFFIDNNKDFEQNSACLLQIADDYVEGILSYAGFLDEEALKS